MRDKIAALTGADFWHSKPITTDTGSEAGETVPGFMLTDGPHGLRKQAGGGDHVGLGESVPATCFPPAAGLGATWDLDLLERIGVALGVECAAEDVGVLLGPGLNLKRHPAGGRNFEYFSEDPLLAGLSAAAMVRGIQSQGVGACPKHYVANNQESHRMSLDTIIDERTLRELYLRGFELAVAAQPWTVMSSYNLVNGEHVGESRRLLHDILRTEFGFDGVVVSDWFAVADRVAAVAAGLDLEMPTSGEAWDERVAAAIESGELKSDDLDAVHERLVALASRVDQQRRSRGPVTVDFDSHHALAREAAAAATVLLTNDGTLPLAADHKIALIGAFAQTPRFQGAGSSLVNPTRLDTVLDSLRDRLDDAVDYVPGYDVRTVETTADQLGEVRRAITTADVAVVMVGLPASYESEGFDRADLNLPDGHNAVVEAALTAGAESDVPVVVVLVNGAPVELPWVDRPAAVVEAYLGGQAGGSALVHVLTGDVEPGGRLAESFPVSVSDLPAHANFANHPTQVEYRETQLVGYRFHDTLGVAPLFCFGHGLGYTTWELSEPTVVGHGTDLTVEVDVANTGDRAGSTVVQLYIHDAQSTLARPEQELKAFAKVRLDAGQSSRIQLPLDHRAFAVYDVTDSQWKVEAGRFELRLGFSSRDLPAAVTVDIESPDVVHPAGATPVGPIATDEEYAALLGRPVPTPRPLVPFGYDSTLDDLSQTEAGRELQAQLHARAAGRFGQEQDESSAQMMEHVIANMPMRGFVLSTAGEFSFDDLDRALAAVNGTSEASESEPTSDAP